MSPADDMLALVWDAPDVVTVREIAWPAASAGQALVDVAFAGICGTDLHIVHGDHPRAKPGLVLGHELVGRLHTDAAGLPAGSPVAVNPLLSCGACAACRRGMPHVCDRLGLVGIDTAGGIAQQVSVPVAGLLPLPNALDLRTAALIEPVAVGVRAVRQSRMQIGDSVHVVGGGPIGLVVGTCARIAGAGDVTLSEPASSRAAVARQLGFNVLDSGPDGPTSDVDARRADVVFDCTGHPSVARTVTRWVATGGTLVTTGVYPGAVPFDLQELLFRELTVVGTRVYTQRDMATAVSLVADGRFDPHPLITAVLPLASAAEAVSRLASGADLKVLISASDA